MTDEVFLALEAKFAAMGGAGEVILRLEDSVAELELRRPKARNALSAGMFARLSEAVRRLESWDGAAVVVHGGASFCAGADLGQVGEELSDPQAGADLCHFGTALTDRLRNLPLVSVAAVEGFAMGGGAELALACDWRVMARDATLHFAHAGLGVSPGWGSAGRLTRALGRRVALEVLLGAKPLGAQEALRLGLVERVSPPGSAVAGARALLAERVRCEPEVARRIKAVIAAAESLPAAEASAVEQAAFTALWGGPAHQRGLTRARSTRKSRG